MVERVVVDAEGMTERVQARIEWVGGGARRRTSSGRSPATSS